MTSNAPESAYKTLKDRILGLTKVASTTVKNVDAKINGGEGELTDGDKKIRADQGENILTNTSASDTDPKLSGKSDTPVAMTGEKGVNQVSMSTKTNTCKSTEKKAHYLKLAEKCASLVEMNKVASAEPRSSIMQEIHKYAAANVHPSAQTSFIYNQAAGAVAALNATRMLEIIDRMEKRAAATIAGADNLDEQLTPEMLQQILQMNAMVPEGEMQPEEQAAILQNSPTEAIHDAAGIVAGNDGAETEDAEAAPSEEELAALEDIEGAKEPDGDEKPEGKGEDADKDAEKEAALVALANHQHLLDYLAPIRGEKIAALAPVPSKHEVALRKIASLSKVVAGLKGVVESQDVELSAANEKCASLQNKAASLEKAASTVRTISPDKVNAMVAEATRAGLVTGSESDIQAQKLAMLQDSDKILDFASNLIRTSMSKTANRLGKVASAAPASSEGPKDNVDAYRENLRKTISRRP